VCSFKEFLSLAGVADLPLFTGATMFFGSFHHREFPMINATLVTLHLFDKYNSIKKDAPKNILKFKIN
jgi:hypothetical protein